jgi:hypothetical protein
VNTEKDSKVRYYVMLVGAAVVFGGIYLWNRIKFADDIYADAAVHRVRQLNRRGDEQ